MRNIFSRFGRTLSWQGWAGIGAIVGILALILGFLSWQPVSSWLMHSVPSATAPSIPIAIQSVVPSSTTVATSTTAPTQSVTPVNSQFAYNFEQGTTQGWDTSEGQYKLATLQVASDPVEPQNHVLQIMTKLTGDTNPNNEVYRHTEAKVYFTQGMPQGFNSPPPYNFQRKQVSCQVYLPEQIALGNPAPSIKIFVKDANQHNDSGKPITITSSIVGKWLPISLIIGQYQGDADQGFDGTQISALGIRVDVPPGSSLNYTGSFYIDNCVLPY